MNNNTLKQKPLYSRNIQLITISMLLILLCSIISCNSKPNKLQNAINCANNWKTKGYDFDPNSMTCTQMFERAEAIRKIRFLKENGYNIDAYIMTLDKVDQKVKDIDRTRFWNDKGCDFDPNTITSLEMDQKGEELDKAKYWQNLGYYYDPNSQTVFLSADKKTKLESLSKLHQSSNGSLKYSENTSRTNTNKVSDQWEIYEITNIKDKVIHVKKGTLLRTTSGNIYEVIDVVFLFEYEYRPNVTILTDGKFYKLFVEGIEETLLCRKVNQGNNNFSLGSRVIVDLIVSDFDGFEHEKLFKLSNGQIWEQTEFYIYLYLATMPKVTIWWNGSAYKMKVDGIEKEVSVRPIR